jgi:cysteinyl-tRNA synthetase
VGRLTSEFEAHMNNDLDVKGAFDSLNQTVTEIYQKLGTLAEVEVKNVLADLEQIDSVLQCLF